MRAALLICIGLLVGLAGGALHSQAAPSSRSPTWDRMWQGEGFTIYPSRATPVLSWPTTKLVGERAYRLCGDVRGTGTLTLAVGDDGDPVAVSSPGAWTHTCVTTGVGWGGGGATLPVALYVTGAGLELSAPVLFAGTP